MLDTSQISKYCFPKDVLFLFQNEQKAKLCMEKIFPDYHNISNEDIRIRIQIMQFSMHNKRKFKQIFISLLDDKYYFLYFFLLIANIYTNFIMFSIRGVN